MPKNNNNLNPAQLEAVNYAEGPLLIVAGAGSGKTKTLTSRVASLIERGVPANQILAITFTNKAASEMKKRLGEQSSLPWVGTFHSFGAMILHKEARKLGRTGQFLIFDDSDSLSLIRKILKNRNIKKEQIKPALIQNKISRIKSLLTSFDDDPEPELMKILYNEYEDALLRNNAFDFDDLIEKPASLFSNNPDTLKKWRGKYQYILVDEFQDTNTSQYQLVKLLADEHKNLNVVGDDAQSIYGWRHADFRNFLNFENDWPKTKTIKLEQNYRSSANIIQAADAVIKNNKLQKQKTLWTEQAAGSKVRIIGAADEEAEADWIADSVSNMDLKETAILYRTNAQSRAIEQALIFAQVPYRIYGGIKFYERKEIKDILAGLRLALNPKDEVSAERLQKNFYKSKSQYLAENLPRLADKLSVPELINFIVNNTDYTRYLEKNFKNYDDRINNIQELINAASSGDGLAEFLEKVSLVQQQDNPNKGVAASATGVNLMTIHLSKGLEFDNVLVSGCNESIMPHQKSLATKEELEEERRLMYVAMTRARKNLFISFTNLASRFLYEIPPELVDFQVLSGKVMDGLPSEEDMWIDYE